MDDLAGRREPRAHSIGPVYRAAPGRSFRAGHVGNKSVAKCWHPSKLSQYPKLSTQSDDRGAQLWTRSTPDCDVRYVKYYPVEKILRDPPDIRSPVTR